MAKSVKQRAAELAEALTNLHQAAERFAEAPRNQDYSRVRAATEEAALQVRCSIAPLESHEEMTAAARALAAVAEARKAVHELAREVMRAQGHGI